MTLFGKVKNKTVLGITALVFTFLLGLALVLLSMEWPLPKFARQWIEAKLEKESVKMTYRVGYFDLLGNIRLEGVSGHYQGLLEFSARQVLVRLFSKGGILAIVDAGEIHTGFLQMPIPETISFSGAIQKREGEINFQFLRLKAGSLVALVRGGIPLRQRFGSLPVANIKAPQLFEKGNAKKDKPPTVMEGLLATFVEKLCSGNKLWVAEADLDAGAAMLTLSGDQLTFDPCVVSLPVLRLSYPFSTLFLSADHLTIDGAEVKNSSLSYSADEGSLWRAMAQNVRFRKVEAKALSASVQWPIATISDKKTAGRISASVELSDHSAISLTEGTLSPLSAKISGRLPPRVLRQCGVKLSGDDAGFVWGRINDHTLNFSYRMGAGGFYGLPFDTMRALGELTLAGVKLEHFYVQGSSGEAQGQMSYNFSSRAADYLLFGKADPVALPWFGKDWADIFKPFGKITPSMALSLKTTPGTPTKASGIAMLTDAHHYHALPLEKTVVAYRFDEGVSTVSFHTFNNSEGSEDVSGKLSFLPKFSATMEGNITPLSLAKAYFTEIPEPIQNLHFSHVPYTRVTLGKDTYVANVKTDKPVGFYSLDFSRLDATVSSNNGDIRIDPVTFGFAGGNGGLTAQVGPSMNGYGSIWVRDAQLGSWSLLGPLSQMLRNGFLSFASLKFNSLDGSFTLEPGKVKVNQLNIWGTEHAATATGEVDTQKKILNFIVHLKTLGGSRPTLGILAPIIQPLTSVLEAHLTGPIAKPNWKLQLNTQ